MDARSEILQKIKSQEKQKKNTLPDPDWENEVLKPVEGDLVEVFRKELEAVGGFCFVTTDVKEFQSLLSIFLKENEIHKIAATSSFIEGLVGENINLSPNYEEQADGLITACEVLVAQTGSVFMSSQLEGGRKSWAYPPIHIVVATAKQLLPKIKDALMHFEQKYPNQIPSQITMITGSSRTADIEKTLVKGAHGPVKLAVFIIKEFIN